MADDQFGIKVSVDTKEATKGLKDLNKEAEKVNQTLQKDHEIKLDDARIIDALNKIDDSIKKIGSDVEEVGNELDSAFNFGKIAAIVGGITAIALAAKSMYDGISNAAHEMVNLGNSAQGLLMNTNNLKAWETTFKSMGFDAKDADRTLSSIQNKILQQRYMPSAQTAAAFSAAGVKLTKPNGDLKNTDEVTLEIAQALKKFKNPTDAQFIGGLFGMNPDLVMQLRNSKDVGKTLAEQKNKPVVTTKEEQQARALVEQQAKLGSDIDALKNEALMPLNNILSKDILPNLVKIADSLNKIVGGSVGEAMKIIAHPVDSFKPISVPPAPGGFIGAVKSAAKTGALLASGHSPAEIDFLNKLTPRERAQAMVESRGKFLGNTGGAIGMFGIRPTWAKAAFKQDGDVQGDWDKDKLAKWLENPENNYTAHKLMMKQDLRDNKGNLAGALREYSGKSYNSKQMSQIMDAATTTPMATESAHVANTINNTAHTSTNNSETHIHNMTVSANNPEEFSRALKQNTKYLSRVANSTGQLA